jgi:LacI family transcriptional regulator
MITLKDISKEVGKSITTVSRALNDYDDVSPETKKMIQGVAEEMGIKLRI